MYAPDKIAWLIFKFMMAMTLFSLILGVANIVPYYMKMHEAANDLVLRASVNNYILKSQVKSTIDDNFTNSNLFNTLTYTDSRSGSGRNSYNGVHVYARTSPIPGDLFIEGGTCKTGEYCSRYDDSVNRVIFDKPLDWDPKTKPNDMVEFNNLNGAQRGDTMAVRIDAKVRARILIIGGELVVGIPLSVEKSGPAMHYFRAR